MADFDPKDHVKSSSSLVNIKNAAIAASKNSCNYNKTLGLVQGLTINLGVNVDRMVAIGSSHYKPIAGAQVITGTMRYLLLPTENILGVLEDPDNAGTKFDLDGLNGLYIGVKFSESGKELKICIEKIIITSWTMSVAAGAVLVYEDVNFEAESVSKSA